MKTLQKFLLYIILVAVVSCGHSPVKTGNGAYHLTCTVDKGLVKGDSASLFIVEDGYQRIIPVGLRTGAAGTALSWDGHIDGARVAFIKWAGDTVPFYLVIEPGNIDITIHGDRWMIKGGHYNGEYMHFLNTRQSILNDKEKLLADYLKHASDSTLTIEMEKDCLKRDSLLTDSLQRYIVWRMNAGDPVSIIVKERFYPTLSKKFQSKY